MPSRTCSVYIAYKLIAYWPWTWAQLLLTETCNSNKAFLSYGDDHIVSFSSNNSVSATPKFRSIESQQSKKQRK